MNAIFQKSRTKRKYTRKPMCANKDGVCDFLHCRCGYSNILDKIAKNSIRKGIDEDLPHRQKVIKRRREIDLMKLDNEIVIEPSPRIDYCCECNGYHGYNCPKDRIKGYTPPNNRKLRNLLWYGLGILLAVVVGYVLIISLIDLIK